MLFVVQVHKLSCLNLARFEIAGTNLKFLNQLEELSVKDGWIDLKHRKASSFIHS